MFREYKARCKKIRPEDVLFREFSDILQKDAVIDGIFVDSSFQRVAGVAEISMKAPVTMELFKNREVAEWLKGCLGEKASVLVLYRPGNTPEVYVKDVKVNRIEIPSKLSGVILRILSSSCRWAGWINEEGEHLSDPRFPSPGPHFHINLLIGNRIGFPRALQTTPKSVVDRLGRGSFRSHADTQVLATRWDYRPEENGFPANRQFYLAEGGRKIFYSAAPNDENIESVICRHSQNYTEIVYKTVCGLEIQRLIFILPQKAGLPIATEVQRIAIRNNGNKARKLRIVYTGMFGTGATHAIFEDVIYTNVIMQTRILKNEDGTIAAISPDYYPEKFRGDIRFHAMVLENELKTCYPTEFSGNYNSFVGNGTLEDPEGLLQLNNHLDRRGPGFFALAAEILVHPGESCFSNNFTGIVSAKGNEQFSDNTLRIELKNLIDRYSERGALDEALNEAKEFYRSFRGFLELKTRDERLNSYVNKNLPFQVLYQTFVSRAFCQTQKGYREIGFREIQDLFMSMYYFTSAGMADFVKALLKEWCSMIFEFGFAYHNFYWVGKEPGKWSDDPLWFIQAVYRYICLSRDFTFLDEECAMADGSGKSRRVFDTIKAVIRYSSQISIGKHGLPLLDYADWNDCLKLDSDFIEGPEKQIRYQKQLEKPGNSNEPLENDYSESVMNGFLLKLAIDNAMEMALAKGEMDYSKELKALSGRLTENLNKHAWKEDFFARVLFNRYKDQGIEYLGAKGDGFSSDPEINGTYFLNSFSWSILSGTANEEQIGIMLDTVEKHLKTPYGLKLITPMDLSKITKDEATGHYFPGDRENGAVFKHASMMAAAALFKAAKEVRSSELASRLARLAYWTVDTVLPYKTMENPYVICGNPRFCTQYINSETGENIGPLLSGTTTWLNLALMSAMGIEYRLYGMVLDPVLREDQDCLNYMVRTRNATYDITIKKAHGFSRISGSNFKMKVDGREINGNIIPFFDDLEVHPVQLIIL